MTLLGASRGRSHTNPRRRFKRYPPTFSPPIIRIRFRGKSGNEHDVALCDRRIAAIVRRCRELPDYELSQCVEDGVVNDASENDYLKDAMGDDYTAKDFRIWGATVAATSAIVEANEPASQRESARVVTAAIRRAADTLGNTVAACRRSYVHPGVLNCRLIAQVAKRRRKHLDRLSADEARALAVLAAASLPLEARLRQSPRAPAGRPARRPRTGKSVGTELRTGAA